MKDRWFGNEFQILGATDENDLEVAMVVLRWERILRKTKKSVVLAPAHILGWEMKDRMAAETGALWK